ARPVILPGGDVASLSSFNLFRFATFECVHRIIRTRKILGARFSPSGIEPFVRPAGMAGAKWRRGGS
ncbi:MAG TPA: hypothetical protein VLW83_08240, partial [Candidatus Acidoferrales bacterium]|nr:hypothetical protein [Candidatus Acidoferrales bacterium]